MCESFTDLTFEPQQMLHFPSLFKVLEQSFHFLGGFSGIPTFDICIDAHKVMKQRADMCQPHEIVQTL